jgi:hypothetical protein
MDNHIGPVSPRATEHTEVQPLGLDQVRITGGFWGRWQERNRAVTIPHALQWLERDGSVDNLRRLVTADRVAAHRGFWFSDSDVYKTLEGIAWDLGRASSWSLATTVDELRAVVERAQEADGYVNSHVQAGHESRWEHLGISHELYCIGHLIQAGVAHKRGTGRDELLAVARRAADCVVREFGNGRRKDTDGHPEIEMALVELHRETGERAYLELAQQFVDARGHGVLQPPGHFDATYFQDATPVRAETTVVGHAVRALYLLCGVVDVHLETGERALLDSALRQWEALTATKTYLTGAVGSRFDGEAFGEPYELPQDLVYGETCATIAVIMLAWRLLLATGERRFADAMERALHNLFAASTSVTRDGFFYSNPAQRRAARPAAPTDGTPPRAEAPGTRPSWFPCACCPPNIIRTVASLGAYVATHNATDIQIHQYLPATVEFGQTRLAVVTAYPIDGRVEVRVGGTPPEPWTLALRIPGWCRGASATVNGAATDATVSERGYLELTRDWQPGDVVVLDLPMPLRFTLAHPAVDAVRDAVAIERGPVVYCLESTDQPDGVDLNRVELLVDAPLTEDLRNDFLGESVVVATARGVLRDDSGWAATGWATLGEQPAPSGTAVRLTAIPYRLWANRGPSVMRTFVPVWRGFPPSEL